MTKQYVNPIAFLDDQLSPELRRLIPSTIKQAYKAADDLIRDQPILEVSSAKSNHGRLRSWATDLAFERLITTGRWPFDYSWEYFEQPTGKYLQIRLGSSLMSVSLVADPKYAPRRVQFRANNALGNPAPFLFDEMNHDYEVNGLPSFILVHGHKQPDFAHIGMPHPEKRIWLDKTGNLMRLLHDAKTEDVPPVEAEDQEAVLTLKDDILKWQRDSRNE